MQKLDLKFALPFTFCVALIVITVWLVLHPVTTFAATCTAKCKTGSVSCDGTDCQAQDGWGCQANGGTMVNRCNNEEEIY